MKLHKNYPALISFLVLIQVLQVNTSNAQLVCCCLEGNCLRYTEVNCTTAEGVVTPCENSCFPNPCIPLPIELIGFWANPINNNQKIQLKWVTDSESENSHFTVEKSVDGKNFDIVTTLEGAGNSSRAIVYSCIDSFASKGISYYRLSQTDFDGRYRHLKIVSVFLQNNEFRLLSSNPIPPHGIVDISFESMDEKMASLIVYDLKGTKKFEKKFQATKGGNYVQVDMSTYPMGVYFFLLRKPTGEFLINKIEKL